jgi:hypothetical protein
MAKQDRRINEHGIDVRNLSAGQWITVRWNDLGDVRCLLLDVEARQATYKGERSLKVLECTDAGMDWRIETLAQSSQVVSIDGYLNPTPINKLVSIFMQASK